MGPPNPLIPFFNWSISPSTSKLLVVLNSWGLIDYQNRRLIDFELWSFIRLADFSILSPGASVSACACVSGTMSLVCMWYIIIVLSARWAQPLVLVYVLPIWTSVFALLKLKSLQWPASEEDIELFWIYFTLSLVLSLELLVTILITQLLMSSWKLEWN